SRTQMTLDVPEQGWHLPKDVFGRREVEELSLCGVKVAGCSLDERPIAKHPEPLARVWRFSPSGLPRRLKVTLNWCPQSPVALPCVLPAIPLTQCLELPGPSQGTFAPSHRHRSPDRYTDRCTRLIA